MKSEGPLGEEEPCRQMFIAGVHNDRRRDVAEAAVIARPDEKWVERPLACVVLREGRRTTGEELNAYLAPKVARWSNPDGYAFVAEVPKTSVGKHDKKTLRERLARGELEVIHVPRSSEGSG